MDSDKILLFYGGSIMAKRRKRLTRQQQWFVLFAGVAILFALGLSAIVSNAGGTFNLAAFGWTIVITIFVFGVGYIVLSIPSVKGRIGEARVNRALKGLSKKCGGRFIHDVMVLGADGKTSQIDHIYVSPKGVFVIETKNYGGRIYGTQNQKQWTQVLAFGHSKHKLYNPVMQNHTHIRRLKEALPEPVDMVSAIVFVRGNIDFIESECVYDIRGLKRLVRNSESSLSEDKLERIATAIESYKENPIATKKEHVAQIKQTQQDIQEGICPRCGGKLVLRKSKNEGREFYGCSNYPKCKFTKPVE